MAEVETMDQAVADSTIDGFVFQDPTEIALAKKEAEGVRYLRGKLDRNNPDYVLTVYNHAVDKKLFVTPVGLAFLKDLRNLLEETGRFSADQIHAIEVPAKKPVRREADEKKLKNAAKTDADFQKVKKRFSITLFFVIALSAALIGMIAIAWLSRDNVTILNYENAIIDKYEDWEQELTERERIVREKEMELGVTTDNNGTD